MAATVKISRTVLLMREEWKKKIALFEQKINLDDDKPGVVPGLRVKHKKSGYVYTVYSVSPRELVLQTPEGEKFIVNADEASEYEIA